MQSNETQSSEHAPRLRTTIALLSVVLSLCAIIGTLWQLAISSNSAKAQTWQGINQQTYAIDQVFVDHPDLRPYFYDSKPVAMGDPNKNAILALCEMYLDFIEVFSDDYTFSLPEMEEGGSDRLLWYKYFRDMFSTSPALRDYAKLKQSALLGF